MGNVQGTTETPDLCREEVLVEGHEPAASNESLSCVSRYYLTLPNDEVLRLYRRCCWEEASPDEKTKFADWIWFHAFRCAGKHSRDLQEEQQRDCATSAAGKVWDAWIVKQTPFISHVGQLVAYVDTVSRNEVVNYFRAQVRSARSLESLSEEECELGWEDAEAIALENLQNEHVKWQLLQALSELTPKQRQVLELHLEGLKPQEIADVLNTNSNQVRFLLHKARSKVKLALERSDFLREGGETHDQQSIGVITARSLA